MSKRVQIAVIREATLNAKPTDTHYLAEGGLCIPRQDAVALKGTTLYYQEIVDLGKVTGGDFIPGRDIPVYTTDSEPVLALQPHMLKLVTEVVESAFPLSKVTVPIIKRKFQEAEGVSHKADTSILMQNLTAAVVETTLPAATVTQEVTATAMKPIIPVANAAVTTDAPVKRRPGRPKKVVTELAAAQTPAAPEPEPEVTQEIPAEPVNLGFEVEEAEVEGKQDDESTFLIEPEAPAPAPAAQPKREFSFDVDEDEAPPPPRTRAPAQVDFEVEDEGETPAAAPAAPEPEVVAPASINTDDFGDVEPGLFDE